MLPGVVGDAATPGIFSKGKQMAGISVDEWPDTKDATGCCSLDQMLRRHGFTIWSRKDGCEPVWIRGGKLYSQSSAVKQVKKELKSLEKER